MSWAWAEGFVQLCLLFGLLVLLLVWVHALAIARSCHLAITRALLPVPLQL